MSVIRDMFDRVEQEHRTKLEQLHKMQEEQRYSPFHDCFIVPIAEDSEGGLHCNSAVFHRLCKL